MAKTIWPFDTARARLTDPDTSHEAAELASLAASQLEVGSILRAGPLTDAEISRAHMERYVTGLISFVFSDSRLRTARAELGCVEAGEGRSPFGRRCKRWALPEGMS